MNDLIKTLAVTGAADIQTVGDGNSDLVSVITTILNVIVGLLGIICVVVIIFGGVQYMTSTGDAGKVKKGKDTILYGIVGLVICALAAVIVNFVIANVIGAN